MSNQPLRSAVNKLADQFADQLVNALRSMSLEDLLEVQAGRPAAEPRRRPRVARARRGRKRAAAERNDLVERIVELVRGRKEGMRAEQIRAELGLSKPEITRPIAQALEQGRLTKKGQRRATTYFAR